MAVQQQCLFQELFFGLQQRLFSFIRHMSIRNSNGVDLCQLVFFKNGGIIDNTLGFVQFFPAGAKSSHSSANQIAAWTCCNTSNVCRNVPEFEFGAKTAIAQFDVSAGEGLLLYLCCTLTVQVNLACNQLCVVLLQQNYLFQGSCDL